MSLHSDMRQKTVAPKTVEELRRAPRPIHTPQWLLPVAVVLFALVAGIIGVSLLRSDDTTTTALEPLIVPEEQAFIDARDGPPGSFGRGVLPRTAPTQTTSVVVHEQPRGVPGMIGYYELEYIRSRTPTPLNPALAPSPASVGFPQLMTTEETGFGQGENYRQPVHHISEAPQGVPGMIGYYELEYIQARVPTALAPSPASVGFPQLMTPEEANYGDGEYFNEAVEDWCLTHTPC